ncbi:hypothetical protein D3C81_1834250 [compost metagenome]
MNWVSQAVCSCLILIGRALQAGTLPCTLVKQQALKASGRQSENWALNVLVMALKLWKIVH